MVLQQGLFRQLRTMTVGYGGDLRLDNPEPPLTKISDNNKLILESAPGKKFYTRRRYDDYLEKAFRLLLTALMAFSFAVYVSAAQAAPFTAPKKLDKYLYY